MIKVYIGAFSAVFLLIFLVALKPFIIEPGKMNPLPATRKPPLPTIRLAVLGNSDSHSYADKIWFPDEGMLRGGKYRQQTLQWTEVLAELRDTEIDQGQWGAWGALYRIATIAVKLGINLRVPRKQDFEYNFAWSGATCRDLTDGVSAQSRQLLKLIAQSTKEWENGIILIRIGINTLGKKKFLDQAAEEGLTASVIAEVSACEMAVESSIKEIHQQHPQLKIVLVGLLNNSDWPPYFQYWHSSIAQSNINYVLDLYDGKLQSLAARNSQIAFFDDRANFRRYFGERGADGKPNYRSVNLAEGIVLFNTQGNSPEHAILEDGHIGTLLNALWARDLINFINLNWTSGLTPISDQEIIDLAKRVVR